MDRQTNTLVWPSKDLLYTEIPNHYVWDSKNNSWKRRQRSVKRGEVISRMYHVSPKNVELYALRLLLLHVRGAGSFADLMCTDAETSHHSFAEAARARGLMQSEDEFEQTLEEILATNVSTSKMCEFFALMLVWHDIGDARRIWENCWESLAHDFLFRCPQCPKTAHNEALRLVSLTLEYYNTKPGSYGIQIVAADDEPGAASSQMIDCMHPARGSKELRQELDYDICDQGDKLAAMFPCTDEQQEILDDLFLCIDGGIEYDGPNVFYVDGPAGAGKTFLYTKALRKLRAGGRIAVAVALSGIAALLLEGGRTAHSRFQLPVPLPLDNAVCNIKAQSGLAQMYRQAALVVWDEAPNAPKAAFEAVDRLFRDILKDVPGRSALKPFGGMPMLLGGDFRQIPPVLRKVDCDEFPAFTIKACAFWDDAESIRKYKLTKNKRAEFDEWYSAFLLSVGDGDYKGCSEQSRWDAPHPASIVLPPKITAPETWKLEDLVTWTYPDFVGVLSSPMDSLLDYFAERVIVTPTNAVADAGNAYMLSLMPAEITSYISYDTIIAGTANEEHYPPEFLHTLDSSGMPPHVLNIQRGALLIVLRNYAPHLGICNGTRVIVESLGKRLLTVRILTGRCRGDSVSLPRICCDSSADGELPFAFRRYQFPVRLAWFMTINKSQGQEFRARVGIHLSRPVFAHGQLYVALSRATTSNTVKVHIEEYEAEQSHIVINDVAHASTLNVVNRHYLADGSLKALDCFNVTSPAPNILKRKRRDDIGTDMSSCEDKHWATDAYNLAVASLPPSGKTPIIEPSLFDQAQLEDSILPLADTDAAIGMSCLDDLREIVDVEDVTANDQEDINVLDRGRERFVLSVDSIPHLPGEDRLRLKRGDEDYHAI